MANELHKPISRNFKKRRVIVNHIDEIWAADLVEMGKFSKWNKGIKFLLTVIDVFSKYGWIITLKTKKGEEVTLAFTKIFKEGRIPKFLWTDKGSEFYNIHMKKLLDKHNIKLYSQLKMKKKVVLLKDGIEL